MLNIGVDPDKIPDNGIISVVHKLSGFNMVENPKEIKHKTLADNGATIEVINESKAEKIIEGSNGNIKMEKGRKFIVENGGAEINTMMEDIIIPTQKQLYKNIYVPLILYNAD